MSKWPLMVQKLLTRGLLGFALISIGFAAGKHAAVRDCEQVEEPPAVSGASGVVVHYMHATFRCVTCNTIERMTRELVDGQFEEELASGRVRMQEVDFQKNESLARRYGVVSSCVVVTHLQNGKEIAHQRLDEVWTLMKDPPAFDGYVGDVIRGYLTGGEAQR